MKKLILIFLLSLAGCGGGGGGGGGNENSDQNDNISIASRLSCTIDGTEIKDSASMTFYKNKTESNGKYCLSEERVCNNGILSGDYQFNSCTSLPEESIAFKIPDSGISDDIVKNTIQFRSNGDNTVTDLNTGLMWQKTPSFSSRTWSQASSYCRSLDHAQYTDWRLPQIDELIITIDFDESTGFNPDYFSNFYNIKLWSNDSLLESGSEATIKAWIFNTFNMEVELKEKTSTANTLCVRGEKVGDKELKMLDTETVSLVGTDLVADTDIIFSTYEGSYSSAIGFCNSNSTSGFSDWRIPTIKEMALIYYASNQLMDGDYFETIMSTAGDGFYATSTKTTAFGKKVYCISASSSRSDLTATSCRIDDPVFLAVCVRQN